MEFFDWNAAKNMKLKLERGICFEDVVIAINEGGLHEVLDHPNSERYPNQRFYVVEIQDYVYVVPFVTDGSKLFLKTIYPSRKLTKQYLKGGK